ncbi:hypothetical protein C8R43DRAFT_962609 [Mycena crocata]|nr:hypothetical protein C8R43DRAFT_962609 [Mycena crocata]
MASSQTRSLGPRGACGVPGCQHECMAFVSQNPDGSPRYLKSTRGWLTHKGSSPLKIGHTHAVGLGMGDVQHFIHIPWSGHLPLSVDFWTASESTTASLAPASMAPTADDAQPVMLPPSSAVVPRSPVVAFTNLARPSTASVQEQRRQSTQRNLHPNEPSTRSPAAGSGSTPTRGSTKRLLGPPRPNSETVATSSSSTLDDFTAAPTESFVTVTVGILPMVDLSFPFTPLACAAVPSKKDLIWGAADATADMPLAGITCAAHP